MKGEGGRETGGKIKGGHRSGWARPCGAGLCPHQPLGLPALGSASLPWDAAGTTFILQTSKFEITAHFPGDSETPRNKGGHHWSQPGRRFLSASPASSHQAQNCFWIRV